MFSLTINLFIIFLIYHLLLQCFRTSHSSIIFSFFHRCGCLINVQWENKRFINKSSQKTTQWYKWRYYQSYIRVATHIWTKSLNNSFLNETSRLRDTKMKTYHLQQIWQEFIARPDGARTPDFYSSYSITSHCGRQKTKNL